MAVSCGFFNSVNNASGQPDRTYDAEDFGKLLDGLILDGVFEAIGDCFRVTAISNTMDIAIGSGKCWLNRSWLVNDASIRIKLDAADDLLNRYDSVVIEVDKNTGVRNGSIKVLKGTAATKPVPPSITNNNLIRQFKIADIYIAAATKSISNANIDYYVGTSSVPYVAGPIKVVGSDAHWEKWKSELEKFTGDQETLFNNWFSNIQDVLNQSDVGYLNNRIDLLTNRLANAENKIKRALEVVSFDPTTGTLITRTME